MDIMLQVIIDHVYIVYQINNIKKQKQNKNATPSEHTNT